MSRGQIPRTPDNFPRMNDRAGRRHIRRAESAEELIQVLWKRCMRTLVKAAERDVKELARLHRPPRYAQGGIIQGPRPDDDSIPAMLSPGYHSLDNGQTWHETRSDDSVLESRVPELNPWAGMGVVALHSHPADEVCDDRCSVYDRTDRPADE